MSNNEKLTLDDFIKELTRLGVTTISLEMARPVLKIGNVSYTASADGLDPQVIDRIKRKEEALPDNPERENAEKETEKPKTEKPKTEKPKTEKPKTEKPATTETKETKPVDKFEHFAYLVEHDDGSKENAAERKAIVNNLKLDDLLRINNEFSCGIDTDCKIGALRKTIISLF